MRRGLLLTAALFGLLCAGLSTAARADELILADVAWTDSGPDGQRLVLQFQPAAATVDVMVRPWGIEVWVPGARATAAKLPQSVVLASEPAGTRLRLETAGAAIRGVRHGKAEVEVLLSAGRAAEGEYRIGIGDVVALSVYKNQDLTGDLAVGPDGTVTVPLLGVVRAAGLTERELAETVRASLASDYLVDPQVSVSVKSYQSQFVHVKGAVPRAARIAVKPGMTLKDILSEAGVAVASGQEVVLSRKDEAPVRMTTAQLEAAGAMTLRDGDVLDVQERGYVVVNGEVRRPGRHVLTPGMTLLEAIALVEGLTDWASKKDVRILHRDDATGAQREVQVNLRDVESGRAPDPVLQAGDVVLVGRRFL